MCTNFEFLKFIKEFASFSNACIEAEKSIVVSPATTAILSRRALELAVKWVYAHDEDLNMPYQDQISATGPGPNPGRKIHRRQKL